MKWRKKTILGTVVAFALLGGIVALLNPRYLRRHWDESRGFDQLHVAALEMLDNGASGVVRPKDGQPYIESFQAYYDFVKAKHPSWVAEPNDPNPFPGVLPETHYRHSATTAINGDDYIFWSETIHPMSVGKIQFRLKANGTIDKLQSPAEASP